MPLSITLSVVSHGQFDISINLLNDLEIINIPNFNVILTINHPEKVILPNFSYPIEVIYNPTPKGFGANHNAAFKKSTGDIFVVANPDISAPSLNWGVLLAPFDDPKVAAVAPSVHSLEGELEDNVRKFPTVLTLFRRRLAASIPLDYGDRQNPVPVDWAAGMFVAFRSSLFRSIGGFDSDNFFMYFEDVDICRRLRKNGLEIMLQPGTSVIHDARRASHRNFQHFKWHMGSALRYFKKVVTNG